MESNSVFVTDALPQYLLGNANESSYQIKKALLEALLKDFTIQDYKSLFFLLMDRVGIDNFMNLTRKEKESLKKEFFQLCIKFDDINILVELFGTMKKYKKLKILGKCGCLYKTHQERELNKINEEWKTYYFLCEEMTDEDLKILKEKIPNSCKDLIATAEDWFWWAVKNEKISLKNGELKNVLRNYPKCLKIIEKFEEKQSSVLQFYNVRTPTAISPCGIAVIFNFENFDEETNLRTRVGSSVDVVNLQNLWEKFGFKTEVHRDLTYKETFQKLAYYAKLNHSNYDLFTCCILSHGKSNIVYSSDGIEMPIPSIIAAITNSCPSLLQKPKLFFINACQGEYMTEGFGKPIKSAYTPNTPDENTAYNSSVPALVSDTLKVISSIDGFVSFRDVKSGSWFIQALCKAMNEFGDKLSILDVIIKVNNEVRKRSVPENALQIAESSQTFIKTLVLKKVID